MLRPGFLIHTALPLSVYAYLSFLTAKRSTFPPTSLLISCYFSSYFTFIPSHIHSLFTLPQFIYSLIPISIFFIIFIQNVKANTVYLHTCDYNENDLNKNESARYYIQFSYCVIVIVCKTGNLAETNFTKRAGKGGVMNWTSAYIQAVATLSSRYANFTNSTEGTTTWNTISGMTRTLRDHRSLSIPTSTN